MLNPKHTGPRIPVLDSSQLDEQTKGALNFILGRDEDLPNLFKTLLHHPDLLVSWAKFADQILFNSSLSDRYREILILRTGFLYGSDYEQIHHTRLASEAGLTDIEIQHIKSRVPYEYWSEEESLLLIATEELVMNYRISGETFKKLHKFFNTKQLIEMIFTVGQYCLVSMVCNSLDIEIEDWAK